MTEDRKEPWLNYLALTTVVIAVCATLATFKGGGYSTRQVLSQARASDEWAYYQAKSVKANLYELGRASAELDRTALPETTPKPVLQAYSKRVADYGDKVAKYEREKAEIQALAKDQERIRDEAQKHGYFFGIAVIFLQISILLSSIAALLKKKQVWTLGLVVGAAGVLYFINGFLLFF
jgi:HAMP domain-containing protein